MRDSSGIKDNHSYLTKKYQHLCKSSSRITKRGLQSRRTQARETISSSKSDHMMRVTRKLRTASRENCPNSQVKSANKKTWIRVCLSKLIDKLMSRLIKISLHNWSILPISVSSLRQNLTCLIVEVHLIQ